MYIFIYATVSLNSSKCSCVDVTIEMLHGAGMSFTDLHQIGERSLHVQVDDFTGGFRLPSTNNNAPASAK